MYLFKRKCATPKTSCIYIYIYMCTHHTYTHITFLSYTRGKWPYRRQARFRKEIKNKEKKREKAKGRCKENPR